MIKYIFLLSFVLHFNCFSQTPTQEEQSVKKVLDDFFQALEKQDTLLFNKVVFNSGQIWSIRQYGDSIRYGMRTFKDDVHLFNPEAIISESPLDYEIKVHEQIASAWVPYTLSVNRKFLHCGIDVFTLLKSNEGWKIANITFTMEPDGCDPIKRKINEKEK